MAIIVLIDFYLFVNLLDPNLRPRLVSNDAQLNFTLMLLAIFGGMAVGGFLGSIFGPVIMVLFVTTIEIFSEYYSEPKEEPDETEIGVLEAEALPIA